MKHTIFGVRTGGDVSEKMLVANLKAWASLAEEIEITVIKDDPTNFTLLWDIEVKNYSTPLMLARVEIVRLVRVTSLLMTRPGRNDFGHNSNYEVMAAVEVGIEANGKITVMKPDFTAYTKTTGDAAKTFISEVLLAGRHAN